MTLTPPPPLAWYRETRLDPENVKRRQRLKERLKLFQPLSTREVLETTFRAWWLERQLRRRHYNLLRTEEQQLQEALSAAKTEFEALRQTARQAKADGKPYDLLVARARKLYPQIVRAQHQLRTVQRRLEPLLAPFAEYKTLVQKLENHRLIVARKREEAARRKEFFEEVGITRQLIREVWGNTKGCHYVKPVNGKHKLIVPDFDIIQIQSHTLTMRIGTARRTLFNKWRQTLPYSVDLPALYAETTLINIAAAIDRQVDFVWNKTRTRVMLKIYRNDAPHGLREHVSLKEMLEFYPTQDHAAIPYPIGIKENNVALWLDLQRGTNMLVAGETRAGKSNYLHSLLAVWLQTQEPGALRLLLADFKGAMEFGVYRNVPHMAGEVITSPQQFLTMLQRLIALMKRRQDLFQSLGATTYPEYASRVETPVPHLVIMADEIVSVLHLGELTHKIHQALNLLGAQGAAVGIHQILATQYPDRATLPSVIKSNLIVRNALKTISRGGSQTILGSDHAFRLPNIKGRGAHLFDPEVIEIQMAYCPEEDRLEARNYAAIQYGEKPLPFAELDDIEEETAPVGVFDIRKVFDVHQYIAIALEHFEGRLTPRVIDSFLDEDSPGIRKIEKLRAAILERGKIEHHGVQYVVKKGERGVHYLSREVPTPEAETVS